MQVICKLLAGPKKLKIMINVYTDKKTSIVYINLTYKGRRIYISTGIKGGTSKSQQHRIRQIVNDCEDYMNLHPHEPASTMKQHLKAVIDGDDGGGDILLLDALERFGESREAENTKTTYRMTRLYVERYDGGISVNDISPRWLDGFYSEQRKNGRMINGIAIDMRNIRASINWAIDNELTTNYPFRRYRIKTEQTRKRNLSDDELRLMLSKKGHKYGDVFLLLLYLRGINISDLLEAKREQLKDGRLEYRRNKTGQLFSVKVEPEAMEIIERRKGKVFLLNYLEEHKTLSSMLVSVNRWMKTVVPGTSSYWSRHTVASIAAKIGVPVDVIGRMLGHSDKSHSTTMIYINFDQSQVDDANRRVIDYLNGLMADDKG